MGLAAQAMVVLALEAVVEVEATAGRAATLHIAAEGLHVTLHGVPGRVLALRHA